GSRSRAWRSSRRCSVPSGAGKRRAVRIANAPAIDALAARLVGAALAPVAPAAPVRNALDASAGARLILQLLSDSTNAAVRGTRAPLLPANETDTGKVVQALRRALAESGLSYEAHLAE